MSGRSKVYEAALKIVEAEVIADRAESAANAEKPAPVSEVKPATDIIDLVNIPVTDNRTLLNVQGPGVLESFLVRSPSTNFSIVLKTEKFELEGDYSHFSDVFAYEESGTYVLELTKIRFKKKCRLVLRVGAPITFSKIFLKYAAA